MNKTKNYVFSLLFLFAGTLANYAQAPAVAASTRQRTFDAQHYVMRSKFDSAKKTYFGDASISVKPLSAGFKVLKLDAVALKVESVSLEPSGAKLDYQNSGKEISINLDKAYNPDETVTVRVKYSATPKKGIYFVEGRSEDGKKIHSDQIWTQGEPEELRHWMPSYDFPDDKATTEQILTVGKGETAIANGELLETKENPDGTKTYHYKMPVPHSVYLISFVIGEYVKVTDQYKNIPLGFYLYPGQESLAEPAYGKTKDMMRVFEEITGVDFPYNKYDQTVVARFNFGGMENITATTMADSEIGYVKFDFGKNVVIDLVSHELAHSWFGNLVTCKNWSELWLNEGFATFMEAAYREKAVGRADYMRKVKDDAERYIASDSVGPGRHPLFNAKAIGNDEIFDTTTYQKGGAVIHTLREEIGDEAFWKAVNIYLNRHKFGNVESTDLKKAMEEASGKDLSWFFDQWVYKAGYPKLTVRQTYSTARKQLTLTISQIQKLDAITPAAFVLPMEIEIQTAAGPVIQKIQVNKRLQVVNIKLGSRPTRLLLDKDNKIPIKTVKVMPLVTRAK